MSGGDGRGPGNSGLGHNGGQASGNVNGTSGKGGPSSGGGTDPNSGPGWGTTHTPNGDIHNYNPGEFGNGGSKPGGNGGNSGNHSGSSGGGQSSATAMAFGLPALATPGAEGLALSVSGDALSAAVADVLAALKGPFKFGLWGIAIYGVLPSEIAKDDPKMMSKIVTSLPADTVTETPVSSLPLDQATVSVTKRVADIVKDERQHIAVVTGRSMSVPVVDAKPTKRPGVFSVSIPGLPSLQVSVPKGVPAAKAPPKGIIAEKGDSRPAGFTAGGNSREAVIRFPKESGQKPVYVSVTDVLTPAQVKQRLEEEKRRQQAWDAAHPEEGLKREYDKAKAELDAEDKNIATLNSRIASTEKAIPGARAAVQEADKKVKEAEANKDDFVTYNPPHEYGSGWQDQVRYLDKDIQNQNEKLKAAQTSLNEMNESLSRDKAALSGAMESRKQKEKKAKDAENKLNEEKKKPRKGTKDYGHDYFPDPKTEDIKGLGELKEGKPKTPKQGGGGKRARWYGDKKRKIYEWDSQHGELEGYRASDGEHLGAFDPKTGKQVKGPDPKRNIKKYL
ncbi:colicin-like bacteriocin tRNase domain-containing protein [Klebsiella pneumoniae]|uniref:colicin-like bacteriocin tRNase domain-containing protein n=1 Tax=Klebsiella pneumoniae TaxID=573 RepID=UPI000B8CC53A|nr:colicin-like bacteriocin tRNase domain-containing protein [Klebsiella pneumoniae]OXU73686.1 cloacin [Klebsiella pneumoniae subsp. pneumoniae]OYG06113.1 cloacin [Klebsiella pneumoniae subsp. pneumoniae]THO01853.1 cloacin [Klebsiella pneumoniae subsp. pneumoniae]HBX7796850.1 cloacin [Klebsiella pneumoniae]HBY8420872.1 cloacin [Klebsiella pneumoniae]